MALKIHQTQDLPLMLMQQQWSQQLNPLLQMPFSSGSFLTNVQLINGVTTFAHYLGRQMQGWIVSDKDADASIYRSEPLNNQTLTLTSDADVTISLWVF